MSRLRDRKQIFLAKEESLVQLEKCIYSKLIDECVYKGGVEGVKERVLSRLSQIKLKKQILSADVA